MVDLAGPSSPTQPIRTYKKRVGRITVGQREAIDRLGARYGLDLECMITTTKGGLDRAALSLIFGRVAPVVLEIGFGMGEATAEMAAAQPEQDVVAVDVHTPGVGNLLRLAEAAGLSNLRVAEGDALVLLREGLAASTLDEVRVFFPDPWPKARHAKRRLVTAAFCDLVASRLVPGGRLHVATDWAPYADQVRGVLGADEQFSLQGTAPARARTRFEGQGVVAGRPAQDICAIRR